MNMRPLVSPRGRRLLPRRRVPLRIAPLRIRLLAVLINATVVISMLGALIAAGAGAFKVVRRLRPARAEPRVDPERTVRLSGLDATQPGENPLAARLQSRKVRFALAVLSFVAGVITEGRQGPAGRVLGIRLVDLRTGKPITRERAAVRVGVRTAWQAIPQRIGPGPEVRTPQESQQYWSEIEEARLRHADDEEARHEALMRIYSKHKPSQPDMWGCWLRVLLRVALSQALELPALWSPLRQGIPDRLAGTVLVLEPRGGWAGRLVRRLY